MIIVYPYIDPVLVSIGKIQIHWYAIMYLIGFFTAWLLARYRVKKQGLNWSSDQVADLIFYCAVGVILGGRLGYMLFYDAARWIHDPVQILKIWEGGMSFHGGFLGVLLALYCFSRKYRITFFEITDFTAPLVPIGLAAGRIGNFINGELWGRATDMAHWGMVFPYVDFQPRHPSQLYECFLEGIVLFVIMWVFTNKTRPVRASTGLFMLCYGSFRIILECFREPDASLGFIFGNWLTMGQLLSFPIIVCGIILLLVAYRGKNEGVS